MKHHSQARELDARAPALPTAIAVLLAWWALPIAGGCSLFPDTSFRQSLHNPFPQLKRVAVLPFFNQSSEPTVDTQAVAESYYAALQAIPGFEVLPVGVARTQLLRYVQMHGEPQSGEQFQDLAQWMGVEAVVVGSVTDFSAYYPPRMAMTVHWYAANESFHPIPAGYGLPWGTEGEEEIPRRIVQEAEFELARSQLATQTPIAPGETALSDAAPHGEVSGETFLPGLPPHWPNPSDLIPDPPTPVRPPAARVNHKPVLSHTRIYRGNDPYVTERLADYVETGDDARPTGWQGYLHRSDDFVRFCCHLHIAEMLEARGGSDESDLILRWPLSRY